MYIHSSSTCVLQEGSLLEIQGVRIPTVVMALAAGLAMLFGLQQAYKYSQVDQPLSRLYSEREEVTRYRVDELGNRVVVRVTLGPVANLRETYKQLEEGTRSVLDTVPFELQIKDNRDSGLVDDFYKLHYILQEGLATGRFTEMSAAFQNATEALGLDEARVFVDTDRVYVQLRRGKHYLYELMPRDRPAAVPADERGGRTG